jgi:acetylornithine/succinyldiaminopimelate/putrescine aminotransferase
VQTGLGRTGRWWGFEHWGLEPDIITVAKSLSGGYVPVGAVVARRAVYQKTFSRLDRCVVHSSTFGRNNLAMACGLATLQVLDDENLIEQSRVNGEELRGQLEALKERHSLIKEVRGLGMMIAIEFHQPKEFAAKMGWKLLHMVESELFAQMIVTTLFKKHRILTQIAGHGMDVVKILPPLIAGEQEAERFVNALDSVLQECRKFPGPIWDFGSQLVRHSLRFRKPSKATSAAQV